MAASPPTPIAIAIIRVHDRVLVGRRPPGVPLAGLCEFPGGKVHADETPQEAAVRECREETGLHVRIDSLFAEAAHRYEHGHLMLYFFLAVPQEPNQPPAEPFCWVPIAELKADDFPPANATVIRQLLATLTA